MRPTMSSSICGTSTMASRPEPASPVVSTKVRERLAERARADARRRLRRTGVVSAALAFAGLAAWIVLASPLLRLDSSRIEIDIDGTTTDEVAVRDAVMAQAGRSLVLIDADDLANDIQAIAGVAEATVTKEWPRGLRVSVAVHQPVAVVPLPDGGFALVAADGSSLGVQLLPPAGVPQVIGPVGDEHARTVNAAVEVAASLPAEVATRTVEVRAETPDTVVLVIEDGPLVMWGSAEDSALKAEVVSTLLAADVAAGATYIDVSAPTVPVLKD